MSMLIFHTILFLVFVVFFYLKFIESQRLKASFKLYEIRDQLVYLVANEVLNEEDIVFNYYYWKAWSNK